jgi:hypothetical protein
MSEQPERPPWAAIPADMAVQSMAKLFATNVSADGRVWLWVRYPQLCIAIDFEPDRADELAMGLAQGASEGRRLQANAEGLQVVERPILGPDGRPL